MDANPLLDALLRIASLEGPNLPPIDHAGLLKQARAIALQAVSEHKKPGRADPAECWKAEADTLRRIVMEALAQFEEDYPSFVVLPDNHWVQRARNVLGID